MNEYVTVMQIFDLAEHAIDPFKPTVTKEFARIPTRMESGHWVWMTEFFIRKVYCYVEDFSKTSQQRLCHIVGKYTSEELVVLNLKGFEGKI